MPGGRLHEGRDMDVESKTDGTSIGRRSALKGAAVAAATVWTTPVIQVLSTETASAASAPPPRVDVPGNHTPPPVQDHPGPEDHPGPVTPGNPGPAPAGAGDNPAASEAPGSHLDEALGSQSDAAPAPTALGGALAKTGADSVGLYAGVGTGAVVFGGAAVVAANVAKRRPRPEEAEPDNS